MPVKKTTSTARLRKLESELKKARNQIKTLQTKIKTVEKTWKGKVVKAQEVMKKQITVARLQGIEQGLAEGRKLTANKERILKQTASKLERDSVKKIKQLKEKARKQRVSASRVGKRRTTKRKTSRRARRPSTVKQPIPLQVNKPTGGGFGGGSGGHGGF